MSDTYFDYSKENLTQIIEKQKKSLCTDPNKLFGYMWYLIRKACKLNQTEMGNYFGTLHKKGLSKSAYSKVENGQNDINFNLVFNFSHNTGIDFDHIYQLYSYIIKKADSNGCYFINSCGNLGSGTYGGTFISYDNTSNEYWYTDLKDYYKFFLPSDLESINNIIYKMFKESGEKEKAKKAEIEWIIQNRPKSYFDEIEFLDDDHLQKE